MTTWFHAALSLGVCAEDPNLVKSALQAASHTLRLSNDWCDAGSERGIYSAWELDILQLDFVGHFVESERP
jgi:hypothetical protein